VDEQEKQEGLGKNHFDKKNTWCYLIFFTNLVFSIRIFNSFGMAMSIAILKNVLINN